jgi:hypothetical protein
MCASCQITACYQTGKAVARAELFFKSERRYFTIEVRKLQESYYGFKVGGKTRLGDLICAEIRVGWLCLSTKMSFVLQMTWSEPEKCLTDYKQTRTYSV